MARELAMRYKAIELCVEVRWFGNQIGYVLTFRRLIPCFLEDWVGIISPRGFARSLGRDPLGGKPVHMCADRKHRGVIAAPFEEIVGYLAVPAAEWVVLW